MTTKLYGRRSKKGMTGLETAIILIAFIIVASTFAFTILNLGFQTAQKSGQVVQNGLNQASSSIQLDGAVVATGNTGNTQVKTISFEIQLTTGAQPVDLSSGKLTVSYTSSDKYVANAYTSNSSNVGVSITPLTGSGTVLQAGSTYLVTVNATGTAIADGSALVPYASFTIELKPTAGSVLTVERTLPAAITAEMNLN